MRGRWSSVVTDPEGNLSDILQAPDKVASLNPRLLFPGHWDPVEDAMGKIAEYRKHRLERQAQVLAEVRRRSGAAPGLPRRGYGGPYHQLMGAAGQKMGRELLQTVGPRHARSSRQV